MKSNDEQDWYDLGGSSNTTHLERLHVFCTLQAFIAVCHLGIFAPKQLSEALSSICGKKTLPRTEVTKAIWAYIKKNNLSTGRIVKPEDADE